MLNFFKKKASKPFPFSRLEADMHSHVLPGIDDGSPDIQTSLELIAGLEELGYARFITTPHAMEDLYPNNRETIHAAFLTLKDELIVQRPHTNIRFAAEYMLDGNIENLLEKKQPLLTIKDNWVLVECSFVSPPLYLRETIFNLQMQGYQPILAHPERYSFYHNQPKIYSQIKSLGLFFQCNLLSFSGYYGSSVRQAAEYLVQEGLVDLLGTDLHHDRHLQHLRELPFTPALATLLDEKGVLNHLL
jgi:tyrosine-protein phosphatase YwqE